MEYFTGKEIKGEETARLIKCYTGWPLDTRYKIYISNREIINYKTTTDNINAGLAIYYPLGNILKK